MSSQKRKAASAKPITSNPLFPAVVALWFGALFGLGSLAVRASLLEGLVLKSHIDLIVPAAAPPLGITARILLALLMAALGAIVGIILARRLALPKAESRERKRGAKGLSANQPRVRSRDAHPDAPARRPISAHEELGEERSLGADQPASQATGLLANRRRALAIIDHGPTFMPQDLAPLPGPAAIEPLDLASLGLPADPVSDVANAAPPAPEPEPISPETAHRDGRQVFGMAPPEVPVAAERQIFGVVADGDPLPQEFVETAGSQPSAFIASEPSPLFQRFSAEPVDAPDVAPVAAPAMADPKSDEPLPSPATLGMTDLAARLADSMRRRRERTQAATTPAVADAAQPQLPAMPAALAALIESTATAVPEAAAEPITPIPVLAQLGTCAPDPTAPAAASQLAVPAAMRPLALDAFLEDDTPFDAASLLPPRHVTVPAPVNAPAAFLPAAADNEVEPASEPSLADAEQDNPYASLLEVAPARQGFVRIDEPEADLSDEIEPVVIFPGQAAQVVSLGLAPQAAAEDTEFRRFDAPASAGQGQPVAAGNLAAAINPDEAAQALRSALSNLQRMSGAA